MSNDPLDWSDAKLIEEALKQTKERDKIMPAFTINEYNIVGNVQLGDASNPASSHVDLFKLISVYGKGIEYKKKRFSAPIINLAFPKATILLWDVFSVVCVGSHAPSLLRLAIQIVRLMVESFGPIGTMKHVTFNNIVAGTDVGFNIDLDKLNRMDPSNTRLTPERFPGLVMNILHTEKVRILIFTTGKCVIMGGSSIEMVRSGLHEIYPLLLQCKVDQAVAFVRKKPSTENNNKAHKLTKKEIEIVMTLHHHTDAEFEAEIDRFIEGKKKLELLNSEDTVPRNLRIIFKKILMRKYITKKQFLTLCNDEDERETFDELIPAILETLCNPEDERMEGWVKYFEEWKKKEK